MTTNCPTCGAALMADGKVRFDMEANCIVGNGHAALLTGKEMELVLLLKNAWPRVVGKDHLCASLYRTEADEAQQKIVDVFVCKLRKKIEGVGITIETARGDGFRLQYDRECTAA